MGQITPTGGGQSQDFEGFQRNNVYQITAKVGKLGIQIVRVSVEPWGDPKNIDVEMFIYIIVNIRYPLAMWHRRAGMLRTRSAPV